MDWPASFAICVTMICIATIARSFIRRGLEPPQEVVTNKTVNQPNEMITHKTVYQYMDGRKRDV